MKKLLHFLGFVVLVAAAAAALTFNFWFNLLLFQRFISFRIIDIFFRQGLPDWLQTSNLVASAY